MSEKNRSELALSIFKHEMKAAEATSELFGANSQDEAEEAVAEAFDKVMSNADSERKAESAVSVIQMLAQQLDSEILMRRTIKTAEQSEYLTVDN